MNRSTRWLCWLTLILVILSALVAHTGWHWMLERGNRLRRFNVQWPTIDALFLAGAIRWLMVAVIAVAALWLVFGVFRHARFQDHIVGADRRVGPGADT